MQQHDCDASNADVGQLERLMQVGRYEARKLGLGISDVEECVCGLRQHMLAEHSKTFSLSVPPPAPGWIRTCARNYAINYCRAQRRYQRLYLPEAESERNANNGQCLISDDPLALLICQEQQQRIRRALNCLTSAQLHVILAYYYEEMDVQEIVAELGCTVNAVHHHLSRARSTLRRILYTDEQELQSANQHRGAE